MSDTSGHLKLKRTIFIRTGGLMVMLAVGILVASTIFVIGEQRDDERQQALGMANFLVDQTNQLGLWDRPQEFVNYFTQITNLHFTFEHVVVEQNGKIVFHTMPAELPHQLLSRDDEVPEAGAVRLVKTADGKAIFNATVAVPDWDSAIHVGVARGPIGEHTRATLQSIAAGSVFALLLGLALAWTVAWMTTREVAAAEAALRESEERYRYLFEHSPDSIVLMKMSGEGPPVIIDCNEATYKMHGYSREEIIGMPISKLDSELDRQRIPERAKRVLAGGVVRFEGEHVRKDGSHFPVEVVARMVEIGGKAVLQGIDRDISDRKKAEEEKKSLEAQLAQAQKMDAIGRLAGGVAHDINNVLGTILGAASLMEDDLGADDPAREHLEKILVACHRGRDFTRNFLGYARKGTFVKERICPNVLIDETAQLLVHTIPKKVTVDTVLDPVVRCLRGDRSLVGQALMNLCLNAVDAMEGEGVLLIETRNIVLDDSQLSALPELSPGEYVEVTIADTGAGMDEETLGQAFEPFFTTKPASRGTGLGLSMVYGTMVSHEGSATIESEPGKGTSVTLLFPATDPPLRQEPREPEPEHAPAAGEGLVLLVEDEQLLRHVGREILERLGYSVIVAEDGKEAVEKYRQRRDEIVVVVLDLVMPEMDGSETFAELKNIDPNVRVLIASGFTNDEVVDELLANGARGFVEKPFDKKTMAEAVARVLGDEGGAEPT